MDGDGPIPDGLTISRLCESFPGCTPSQMVQELEEHTSLVLEVMATRNAEYWVLLARRAKRGDEGAMKELQEAPKHLLQTLKEIVVGLHDEVREDVE